MKSGDFHGEYDCIQDSMKNVRNFYDRQVLENPELPAILGVPNKLVADFRDQEEWRTFQKLVPLRSDMNVLELGCGGGRWCEHLSPFVRSVNGVDFSNNAISYAKRQADITQLRNIVYHHSSLEKFQPSEKFDLIYFSGVALYLEDSVLADCISRYSKYQDDKGLIIIVRDSVANLPHFLEHDQGYSAQYRTIDNFKALFESAGFLFQHHEKAFPNFCLSRLLANKRVSASYDIMPTWLKRLLLRTCSLFSAIGKRGSHWNSGDYQYDHSFLVFSKTSRL